MQSRSFSSKTRVGIFKSESIPWGGSIMRYGYFDNDKREYVIDRVDVPVSWTNYIGLGDMYGVFVLYLRRLQ